LLTSKGLKAAYADVDSEKAAGMVISANPPANTTVDEGSTVKLTVSRGNLRKLPLVVGQTEQAARSQLSNSGFKNVTVVRRDADDPSQVGKVVGQDPESGILDPKNTSVQLIVAQAVTTTPTTPPGSPNPSQSAPSR